MRGCGSISLLNERLGGVHQAEPLASAEFKRGHDVRHLRRGGLRDLGRESASAQFFMFTEKSLGIRARFEPALHRSLFGGGIKNEKPPLDRPYACFDQGDFHLTQKVKLFMNYFKGHSATLRDKGGKAACEKPGL